MATVRLLDDGDGVEVVTRYYWCTIKDEDAATCDASVRFTLEDGSRSGYCCTWGKDDRCEGNK